LLGTGVGRAGAHRQHSTRPASGYPNPDGWLRGSISQGGFAFQRYNGNGFRSVGARPSGKGLELDFARRISAPVTVDVLAQTTKSGRSIASKANRVARFTNRVGGFAWNGKATVKGAKVADGIYVLRYTIAKRAGKSEVRHVTLERKKGKWRKLRDFERRPGCDAVAGFTLYRPVFGGKSKRSLRIGYRLASAGTTTIVVKRGKKTVKRFKATKASAKKTYVQRVGLKGLKRGDYTVTLTLVRGKAKTTARLVARRL
jgi:hypothetical protein